MIVSKAATISSGIERTITRNVLLILKGDHAD